MQQFTHLSLFKHPSFGALVFVYFITYFGAWFSQVGVYTLLLELPADESTRNWAITISTMFVFLPTIILAPINGVIVDKFAPKRLLLCMLVVEMFSIAALLLIDDYSKLWFLYGLIFVRLAVASVYFQAQMALLPRIYDGIKLRLSNELFSILWGVAYTSGMALAGIFIHRFGVPAAFMIDCFFFLISIIVLAKTSINLPANGLGEKTFSMIKTGALYLISSKKIMHLILLHGLVGLTSYDALISFLSKYTYLGKVSFGSEIFGVALLMGLSNSVRSISLVIGPIILSKYINKQRVFYYFLAQGICILIWALVQDNFYLSLLAMLGVGFWTSALWSYTYTMIQENCEQRFYGRILAYVDMIYLGIAMLTTLFVGALFDLGVSSNLITALLGLFFIFTAIYWKFYLRHYE